MNELQLLTKLEIGWINAWIPQLSMLLIQLIYMLRYKEGGKRAIDTSWYTSKEKRNANWSFLFQNILLLVSIVIPLRIGTIYFFIGSILFTLSLIAFIAAFHAYMTTPPNQAITKGIYRLSRNPMYFAFNLGIISCCIASTSLWLILIAIPFIISTHLVILGEECYCEKTYGKSYLDYKTKTARYFLIV